MVRRTLHVKQRLYRHHCLYHADTNNNMSVRPSNKTKVYNIDSDLKDMSHAERSIPFCESIDCYDNTSSYEYFKRNSNPDNPYRGPAYMIGVH